MFSPVKGLNLFSRSKDCLPIVPRSTLSSGQMAYSSMILLIWKILFVTASGAGPALKIYNDNAKKKKKKTS